MKRSSTGTIKATKELELTEIQVLDYLRNHPKFFIKNGDILNHMEAPNRWTDDGVIDMQRFLLDRRSTEINELRDCAQEVIETSRSNLSVQTRTHAAILALIGTNDFGQFVQVLNDDIPFYLDVDIVTLGFEPSIKARSQLISKDIILYTKGTAETFIGTHQEIRLYPKIEDDGTFFGSGAGLVCSGALARINASEHSPIGILALGSREEIFHPGQGTELINFLKRVIESMIHKHLEKTE